ncbi:MAG: hypothetical protein HYS04_08075 [Acidobacteria bacterium]|nr:hypothetical protein [Acidobacteriota bacterium]
MKLLFSAAAVAGVLFAQETLRRERNEWVRTVTGSCKLSAARQLNVISTGPVTLQGTMGQQCRYTLRKRLAALSEAEAQAMARRISVEARVHKDAAVLAVREPPGPSLPAELEVSVPKSLRSGAIRTQGGNVLAQDIAGKILIESVGGQVQLDRIGGDAVARTGGGEIRAGSVGGILRLYTGGGPVHVENAGGEAWLESGGGEIFVREASGPVHASTAGGNVVVRRAASYVTAHTGGGRIDVREARGRVNIESSGGPIEVGSANGVQCQSSGGAIRLRGAAGEMKAVTHVGAIFAELLAGAALRDSMLSTGNGDIVVFIPSNVAVTVRARSEGARWSRIVSEFPEIAVRASSAPVIAEGSLNGGGPLLYISTAGGTIYLRRQK